MISATYHEIFIAKLLPMTLNSVHIALSLRVLVIHSSVSVPILISGLQVKRLNIYYKAIKNQSILAVYNTLYSVHSELLGYIINKFTSSSEFCVSIQFKSFL